MWPFRARRVARTCQDCGATWSIAAKLAKAPRPGWRQRGFAAGSARYAQQSGLGTNRANLDAQFAEAHRRDAAADQKSEALRQAQSCPHCGGHDLKQA